jgi:hypothetical protein
MTNCTDSRRQQTNVPGLAQPSSLCVNITLRGVSSLTVEAGLWYTCAALCRQRNSFDEICALCRPGAFVSTSHVTTNVTMGTLTVDVITTLYTLRFTLSLFGLIGFLYFIYNSKDHLEQNYLARLILKFSLQNFLQKR